MIGRRSGSKRGRPEPARVGVILYGVGLAVVLAFASATCESETTPFSPPEEEPGDTTDPIPGDTVPPTIALDPATRHQTMTGWYATSQAGQLECATFPRYQTELYDRTVDELGLNRIKLAVRAGAEHPQDYFGQFITGVLTFQQWQDTWFHAVNDNADPNSMNPAGFHWGDLDHKIENMALPMKQRLETRGERLYIMIGFTDHRISEWDHKTAPEEYAEYIVALYQHMQSKYGFVPDIVEVINEPDTRQAAWTAAQIAQAVVATGKRLEAAGFTPRFAAPGTTNMQLAVTFYDRILQNPEAKQYITELSYHRYNGVSDAALTSIGQRVARDGIGSNMSEHIGSGYEDLHKDLTIGNASAWMQFALGLCGGNPNSDGGGVYYNIDESNASNPRILPQSRTPYLAQYFRNIRIGAQRIGATSANAALEPVAFINPGGGYAVVVKANGQATFTIGGLPAGRYGIGYTTAAEDAGTRPDVALSSGAKLQVTIPDRGVVAVFRK